MMNDELTRAHARIDELAGECLKLRERMQYEKTRAQEASADAVLLKLRVEGAETELVALKNYAFRLATVLYYNAPADMGPADVETLCRRGLDFAWEKGAP